jgi:hypothetical protein
MPLPKTNRIGPTPPHPRGGPEVGILAKRWDPGLTRGCRPQVHWRETGASLRGRVAFSAMFGGETDPLAYLYHYTTRDAALGNILPLRQLRLSPLAWTNDPRGSQPWLYGFSGPFGDAGAGADDIMDLTQAIDDRIRSTTKVACLTRSDPELMAEDGADYNFARGWSHSRMWDRYAEGHRGVCLVFDREKLSRQMGTTLTSGVLWEKPVEYENVPQADAYAQNLSYPEIESLSVEAVAEQHVAQHWQALFFFKSRDWESEWEYQWVYRNGQPGPAFVAIEDALAGVMVGANFPEVDIPLLRHFSDALDFSTARCWWRNGFPVAMS